MCSTIILFKLRLTFICDKKSVVRMSYYGIARALGGQATKLEDQDEEEDEERRGKDKENIYVNGENDMFLSCPPEVEGVATPRVQ